MDVFVARQPIFDRREKVVAYELLFRSGNKDMYDALDGDLATSKVITNSFLVIGLEAITDKKRAFINFTDNLLRYKIANNLPRDLIGIEILENVVFNEQIYQLCLELKRQGYLLILDDFVMRPEIGPFIDVVDIIKVDFLATSPFERQRLPQKLQRNNVKFLAEKIESKEVYQEAIKAGYSYFQGYFFSKPVIMAAKDVPGYKLNYLKLLRQLSKKELDFDEIEQIIKQDLSLSYKLLKFINSAAFGFRSEIRSIKYALILLGPREVAKWISLIVLKGMGEDKPEELMVNSLVRARFGELLAPFIGMPERSADLFLMGMFSLIDAFMDRPKKEILDELPIAMDIKNALLGEANSLQKVYELILNYEVANWEKVSELMAILKADEKILPQLYQITLAWVSQINS